MPGNEKWLELNAAIAPVWPSITVKREPSADAKAFDGLPGKFDRYFSPDAGRGD